MFRFPTHVASQFLWKLIHIIHSFIFKPTAIASLLIVIWLFPGVSTISNAWNLLWKCFFGKEQPLQQKLVDVKIVIKIKREIIILSVVRGKKADSPCCCFATAYGVTVQHVSTCVFFYGDIRTRTCKKVCVTCIDKHLQQFSFYSQEELLVIVISIILLIGQKRTCYGPKEHKFLMRDKERATYKHKTQKKHEVSFQH